MSKPAWMTDAQWAEHLRNTGAVQPAAEPVALAVETDTAAAVSSEPKLKRPARRAPIADQRDRNQNRRDRDRSPGVAGEVANSVSVRLDVPGSSDLPDRQHDLHIHLGPPSSVNHSRPRKDQPPRYRGNTLDYRNNDEHVREHYNARARIARREVRALSPIIKMRNFNNAIKYILINTYTTHNDRVLDLGCGKGGDLYKYLMAGISQFVGIDILDVSIVEAVKRYLRMQQGRKFEAFFATGDCYGVAVPDILAARFPQPSPITFPFDVVLMQFCMHYAFELELKARVMLRNVANSLKPGGFFIGTIPDLDFIRRQIVSNYRNKVENPSKFGNSIYSATFDQPPPEDGMFPGSMFGHRYLYYLKDAVENVPEYVVPFLQFRALAEEFHLELRYRGSFVELFNERIEEFFHKLSPKIIEGMRRSDGKYGVEGDEKDACAFYLAFAFQKM